MKHESKVQPSHLHDGLLVDVDFRDINTGICFRTRYSRGDRGRISLENDSVAKSEFATTELRVRDLPIIDSFVETEYDEIEVLQERALFDLVSQK